MKMNRRDFAVSTLVLGAGIRAARSGLMKFRFSFCNESMKGMPWPEQCKLVGKAGYQGIEIAAFSLVKNDVGDLTQGDRRDMLAAMKDAGLTCAGLHWLLMPPPPGLHCTTPDKAVRQKSWDYLRQLIDFCGDLQGSVMVFGSPKQRNTEGITVEQAVGYFTEGLRGVADQAASRQVSILIEPLDHSQTDVVNTLAEAAQVVAAINHPAIKTMFDFHNTLDEKEPFDLLIRKYFNVIRHIHIQEMDGKYLGAGTGVKDYGAAFRTIKALGYDRWISVEVFDFTPGPQKLAEESMKALRALAQA
jgi:D-psicose/D-tagatose/L-ribulose 3-epimerase